MIHQTCYCDVKPDKINDVIEHTQNWISTLQMEYQEPIHYDAFQERDNPNVVCYFIQFTDKNEEEKISNESRPRKFGEKLYSMCIEEPVWKYHKVVAGFRNSNKDSKMHVLARYTVQPDKVDDAIKAISDYVDEVKKNEPFTRVYEVWQQDDEPTNFIHIDESSDENSFMNHKNSEHTEKFLKLLHPICVGEPEIIFLNQIGSKEHK